MRKKVSDILPKTEILAQAALKLRRALDGTNPTPKSVAECEANLLEEWADVNVAFDQLWDDKGAFQLVELDEEYQIAITKNSTAGSLALKQRSSQMNKRRNRPSSGKQAMSANLRKIARQNQLYGFRMALDGIAATWGALIQNLRFDADLTDEQVQKIIYIGDRYWEMVGKFKEEDMTPDEFADYITAKSEQVEKELRERWS